MVDNESLAVPAYRRRKSSATIALWVFVIVEAIGLVAVVWYTLGAVASRYVLMQHPSVVAALPAASQVLRAQIDTINDDNDSLDP